MKKKAMLGLCIIFLLVLATIAFASQTQVALTYDPNGNLLTNGDKRYVYDGFNRLAEVFINETIKEKYWYDPDGNRLLKVEFHSDGSNTTTFYIDNSFVRIMNASGTYDEVYYYDEYDLIAKEDAEGKKFYHPDHLGSTTLVTNEAGEIVEETVYDPYGAVQEGGNERHDYEGKETDFSGLQYFGARYYDPGKPKRWTQPDSLLPDVYDPQQLNRYAFERNNPYRYTDPEGHCPACVAASVGFVIGSLTYMMTHSGSGWEHVRDTYLAGTITASSFSATTLFATVGGRAVAQSGTVGLFTATGTAVIGAGGEAISESLKGEELNPGKIAVAGALNVPSYGLGLKPGTFMGSSNLLSTNNVKLLGQLGIGNVLTTFVNANVDNHPQITSNINSVRQSISSQDRSYASNQLAALNKSGFSISEGFKKLAARYGISIGSSDT